MNRRLVSCVVLGSLATGTYFLLTQGGPASAGWGDPNAPVPLQSPVPPPGDSKLHGHPQNGIGFTTYAPLLMPEVYQADSHFNPARRILDPASRLALQDRLSLANSRLAELQARLRARSEEWGRTLIENGIVDAGVGQALTIQPGTTRVGLIQGDTVATVTIRPGDNAELDELAALVHEHMNASHDMIQAAFR